MTARLENAIRQLPPEAVRQVEDFAESLARTQPKQPAPKMNFSWRGALSDLKRDYKSGVELQHDIAREWADNLD